MYLPKWVLTAATCVGADRIALSRCCQYPAAASSVDLSVEDVGVVKKDRLQNSLGMVYLLSENKEELMHVTLSSKNQLTLPKNIVLLLSIHQGDILSVKLEENRIILTPQTLEDKYPEELLARVENKLKKVLLPGEKKFSSVSKLIKNLKA